MGLYVCNFEFYFLDALCLVATLCLHSFFFLFYHQVQAGVETCVIGFFVVVFSSNRGLAYFHGHHSVCVVYQTKGRFLC